MTQAKSKKITQASDLGTPERGQHGDDIRLIESSRAGEKRAYVVTQTPLDRLLARGQLGGRETGKRRHEAGNRFYGLFWTAGLSNAMTASMEPRIRGGVPGDYYRVLCLDAYNEYMRAREIIRAGAVDVVYSTCCLGESPGGSVRTEMLRLGLDDLAHHFRV